MTIELLHCHNYNNQWIGSDFKERYYQNLKSQPLDWQWRDQKVEYTLNSQNYRTPEWDTIDWDNSIVIFGCSQIFGVGVSDNQTVGYYLSELLNKPVINLGMPGGSCMAQWINTEKLLKYKINPAAVIYNWPTANRMIELIDNTQNQATGIWNLNDPAHKFAKEWVLHPTHGFEYAKYAVMSVRRSWFCPQLHYSWCADTSKFSNIRLWNCSLDLARDYEHVGPKTLKIYALHLYHELTKLKNFS